MSFENGYTGAPFAPTQEDTQQMSQETHHAEPSLHQLLPHQQQVFPNQQTEDISQVRDFKSQLPLARVKKRMKADEDVKMIAADVPADFAKAGGPFTQTEEDIQRQARERRGGGCEATQHGTPQIHQIFQATQHAEPSLHQPLPSQQQVFPNQQTEEISQVLDIKNQFPLARVKKIMKADEDVKMITVDAPAVLGKACELFIEDLTRQSWIHTHEKQRRTLKRNDVADAIACKDLYDFLIDIVPREEKIE